MSSTATDFSLVTPSAGAAEDRILIVDDEASVRNLFAEALGIRYPCSVAPGAREALEQLAGENYSLVITDVHMPGLSGIELLREIIARFPETAVIMVSGVDRTQRVLDAVRLGAFDYLIKPCDLHVLELCVERALERRTLLRDAKLAKQRLEKRNEELAHRQAELQRLQAQIVQSEKMASLGQLAAGVAHELNNPAGFIYGNMDILAGCLGGIERLLSRYDAASMPDADAIEIAALKGEIDYDHLLEDIRSITTDCRDGAERIRDVVENLRTFSRLDEAEFKKVDIHDGLNSTLKLLTRYYPPEQIALHKDYNVLPLVDCYAGQLNQVWMNLLVNAAHAIDGSGEVRISTEIANDSVSVTISDTGKGIAPEHLRKIFDPFFTTKPIGEGTGLGLSIAYGIVKRHGGSIEVDSLVGRGTTFKVTIPVNAKRAVETQDVET